MRSFTGKNNSFTFSINDNSISMYHLDNNQFFSKKDVSFNLKDITKIETLPGPIYIGSINGGLVLNKEDFTSEEWVAIKAELCRFKMEHGKQINENLVNSVIGKIKECCGLGTFKELVEMTPYKESSPVKGEETLFRLGVLTRILFKGEEGWIATTPYAKEIYDSLIQKGL